jgi:anti-sigma regulatory factor (Ser/Thr protein kinase)
VLIAGSASTCGGSAFRCTCWCHEQLRTETLRAEEANRAKSASAAASHDLRQPLHALGLFIASLRRTPLDEGQTDLLTHMDGAARAAGEMLNTLLDFSRLEAGVIEANPQPFPLQPMLRKLEAEFAPQAEQKQLVFRQRDTPAICHTDPSLLELVLRNLIANAVRYTERGGLLIACRRPRAGLAVIEVTDTGIGIPASQHETIFQAFHQLGNPERDRRHGLGLGLAIVRQLVRTMDLALSLASRPGRGSVSGVRPLPPMPGPAWQTFPPRRTSPMICTGSGCSSSTTTRPSCAPCARCWKAGTATAGRPNPKPPPSTACTTSNRRWSSPTTACAGIAPGTRPSTRSGRSCSAGRRRS